MAVGSTNNYCFKKWKGEGTFSHGPCGKLAGPAAGPDAGPAAGPAPGPAAGPVPGPDAGPVPGPAAGPAAGPDVGPDTGPIPGPAAGPATELLTNAADFYGEKSTMRLRAAVPALDEAGRTRKQQRRWHHSVGRVNDPPLSPAKLNLHVCN